MEAKDLPLQKDGNYRLASKTGQWSFLVFGPMDAGSSYYSYCTVMFGQHMSGATGQFGKGNAGIR